MLVSLDRAVRILAVRTVTASRNYGVNSRAGDGQKWAGKRLMRRQTLLRRVIARCREHHYLDDGAS